MNDAKSETEAKPEETPAAPPTAAVPPVNLQMPIQLVLTVEQINICLAGLSKLPLEMALNTFQVLKGQGDMAIAVSQGLAGRAQPSPTSAPPGPNGTRPADRRARRKTH